MNYCEEYFLKEYRRFIDKQVKLSASDERELIHQYKSGDESSFTTLTHSNLYLVIKQVWRHLDSPLPIMDIIQMGNVALIESLREFNPGGKYNLKPFIMLRLYSYLRNSLFEYSYTLRVPINIFPIFEYINLRRGELHDDYHEYCEELYEYMDLKLGVEEVKEYLQYPFIKLGTDKYDITFCVSDFCAGSIKEELKTIIYRLPKRSAQMIDHYFGITNNSTMTLEEIGERFGLTRERVRQINNKSLEKLNSMCHDRGYYHLLEPQYLETVLTFYDEQDQRYSDIEYINSINLNYKQKRELFLKIFKDVIESKWQSTGLSTKEFINQIGTYTYKYLELEGEPHHFADIYNELTLHFGEFPKFSLSRALKEHDQVIQIRHGIYALREWGFVPNYEEQRKYDISVEEGVLSVLEDADSPLSVSEIISIIEEKYQGKCSTIRRSIYATLSKLNNIKKDLWRRYYIERE